MNNFYKNISAVTLSNEKMELANRVNVIYKSLLAAGFPAGKLITTYSLALAMLESNWMSSNVSQKNNNYSGIKFVGQQGATKGILSPEGNNYANFATINAWAKDYLRVLSLNTGKKGRPIDAANADEFITRLRANGYFTDPNYATKFNSSLRKLSELLTWYNNPYKPEYGTTTTIQYQGTSGNPNKQIPVITPGTETIIYSKDPKRSQNIYEPFPDVFKHPNKQPGANADWYKNLENWAKDHPILTALSIIAVGVGIKKITE